MKKIKFKLGTELLEKVLIRCWARGKKKKKEEKEMNKKVLTRCWARTKKRRGEKKRTKKKCLPDVEPAADHALTDWIKFLHSELEEQRWSWHLQVTCGFKYNQSTAFHPSLLLHWNDGCFWVPSFYFVSQQNFECYLLQRNCREEGRHRQMLAKPTF